MKLLLLVLLNGAPLFLFRTPAHAQIITTIAGTIGSPGYSGDGGPAINATLHHPYGLAVDNAGNIYVFDQLNAVIRKINSAGIITTFAGNGTVGFSGDGGPATSAQIGNHYSGNPAIDNAGNVYISDAGNHVIRKINTAGIISTIAGNGTFGFSGDGGQARSAQILPRDIALDNAGNLYIADGQSRIRKVSTNGIITTIAGTGTTGFSGDGGPALTANIDIVGIAVDNAGNIYFSDVNSDRIRKINTAGIISTIAGTGTEGYSGDNGPAIAATLKEPYDVHADALGNIFIADYNHTIRKINTSGIISTVVGNGTPGYSGDGGPAVSAQLQFPLSVWVDNNGDIYVMHFWEHHTIRKVSDCISVLPSSVSISSSNTTVCSNTSVKFTANAVNGGDSPNYIWRVNGQPVAASWNTFTFSTPADGDIVSCDMISSIRCTAPVSSANTIQIHVKQSPVIILAPDILIDPGNSTTLNPSITGTIVEYLWSPPAGLSNVSISNPVASPAVTTTYLLTVKSEDGCEAHAKTTISIYQKIFMPSAFTPNSDGRNDIFRIPPGTTINLRSLSVYDRAGQIVFTTNDIDQGWDGKYKGLPLPAGVYVYLVQGDERSGKVISKGTVMLIH